MGVTPSEERAPLLPIKANSPVSKPSKASERSPPVSGVSKTKPLFQSCGLPYDVDQPDLESPAADVKLTVSDEDEQSGSRKGKGKGKGTSTKETKDQKSGALTDAKDVKKKEQAGGKQDTVGGQSGEHLCGMVEEGLREAGARACDRASEVVGSPWQANVNFKNFVVVAMNQHRADEHLLFAPPAPFCFCITIAVVSTAPPVCP